MPELSIEQEFEIAKLAEWARKMPKEQLQIEFVEMVRVMMIKECSFTRKCC